MKTRPYAPPVMDTSEPAFPFSYGDDDYAGRGMSLRDYFAGQALVGVMASANGAIPAEQFAAAAYQVADAMLAARKSDA